MPAQMRGCNVAGCFMAVHMENVLAEEAQTFSIARLKPAVQLLNATRFEALLY
jgi:hypothetical protein